MDVVLFVILLLVLVASHMSIYKMGVISGMCDAHKHFLEIMEKAITDHNHEAPKRPGRPKAATKVPVADEPAPTPKNED